MNLLNIENTVVFPIMLTLLITSPVKHPRLVLLNQ